MPLDGGTIGGQVGAAQGLWTHTPVDWRGNETGVAPPGPAGWPANASAASAVFPNGSPSGATGAAVAISAISVTGITTIAATINFTLSAQATNWIDYGTTTAYGSSNTTGSGIGPQVKPLSALTTGTVYHYRITAISASGLITTSPDATFTTS